MTPVKSETSTFDAPRFPVVGWREWVKLPLLSSSALKVKVDTGATTSALHAEELQIDHDDNGLAHASFWLHPGQDPGEAVRVQQEPVVGFRFVRSSSGHGSYRPVIRTKVALGNELFLTDITLADRDPMGFRMLLGRRALRDRFHVDPSRSFLQGGIKQSPAKLAIVRSS